VAKTGRNWRPLRRPSWLTDQIVSCPVALFPASSEREKISFNQLNKKTGNRIRYRKVDAETGDEVDSSSARRPIDPATGTPSSPDLQNGVDVVPLPPASTLRRRTCSACSSEQMTRASANGLSKVQVAAGRPRRANSSRLGSSGSIEQVQQLASSAYSDGSPQPRCPREPGTRRRFLASLTALTPSDACHCIPNSFIRQD
jgi:Ku70/Ku80 beta-barrel domain